jgi:hypothetical protein
MRLDPNTIRQQISNLLLQYPELQEDEVLRADMIEGETEAFDFLSVIVAKILDTDASVSGLDTIIDDLKARQDRMSRRHDSLRALAFKIMQAADLRKAELTAATLSVRQGNPRVILTDETLVPDAYCRIKKEPNKAAIKAALETGEHIPGATLSNAEPSLTVRIK